MVSQKHKNTKMQKLWSIGQICGVLAENDACDGGHQKFLYTPTGAWYGKNYGMAWPYFFSLDAVHRPHTTQKDMNIKKYYK